MSPARHHDMHWDELAAGYALHALEPEDAVAFETHVADCTICQGTLDDHSLVAAQLASLSDDAATAAPSWSRIRPALDAARPLPPAQPALPQHTPQAASESTESNVRMLRPRHTRFLAAAAAFVGLVGVAVAGWHVAGGSSSGSSVPSAVASCRTSPDCHVVRLLADGKVEAGDVLVREGSAAVVPTAMPKLDAAHVYVLWQMPRDGRPTPVTALQHVTTAKPSGSVSLIIPYADTAAFAMSVERADQVPTQPTRVVAVGTAT